MNLQKLSPLSLVLLLILPGTAHARFFCLRKVISLQHPSVVSQIWQTVSQNWGAAPVEGQPDDLCVVWRDGGDWKSAPEQLQVDQFYAIHVPPGKVVHPQFRVDYVVKSKKSADQLCVLLGYKESAASGADSRVHPQSETPTAITPASPLVCNTPMMNTAK